MLSGIEAGEWPRERLMRSGLESLTDAELVALVLRTGIRGKDAVAVGRELLAAHGGVAGLAVASVAEIAASAGVGKARASALQAAIGLGRRADGARMAPRTLVRSSAEIHRHFHDRMIGLDREHFYVALLDGKGRIQEDVRISEGTLTASLVHPREVFRCAVRRAAASLVLVHNHPSGDPTPSPEDQSLTDRMVEAGRLMGIPVLDHVVIGAGCFVSFVETGRLARTTVGERVLPVAVGRG